MRRFLQRHFHPYLLAILPVLWLWSINLGEVDVTDIVIPLFALLVFAFAVRRASTHVSKDGALPALMLSLLLVFVFSYQSFLSLVSGIHFGESVLLRYRYWLVVYLSLFLALGYLISKRTASATRILNISSFLLVSLSVVKIAAYEAVVPFQTEEAAELRNGPVIEPVTAGLEELVTPDIYYIVLDGYGSAGVLKDYFAYDNSAFVEYLKGKGFYLPTDPKSNYAMTGLSVPSSLSMDYIANRQILDNIENEARTYLEERGYRYIYVSSSPALRQEPGGFSWRGGVVNEFTMVLLRSSVFDLVATHLNAYAEYIRRNTLDDFEELKTIPDMPGRKFVFAHILAPHPPYVFGPDGEAPAATANMANLNVFLAPWDDRAGYINQLQFVNKKTMDVVETLLKKSTHPPIIILQADHGPKITLPADEEVRVHIGILNAYYLPGDGVRAMYDTITPVNSLRVVFNHYFQDDFQILGDKSYFSPTDAPFDFQDVTTRVLE